MKELNNQTDNNMQGSNNTQNNSRRGNFLKNSNELNSITKYNQNTSNDAKDTTGTDNNLLGNKNSFSEKKLFKYINEKIFDSQSKKNESESKKEEKKKGRDAVVNQENGELECAERYEITPSKRQRTRKLWTRAFQKVTSQRLQGTLSFEVTTGDKCCDNNDIELNNVNDQPQNISQGCDDTVSYGGGKFYYPFETVYA